MRLGGKWCIVNQSTALSYCILIVILVGGKADNCYLKFLTLILFVFLDIRLEKWIQ